MDPAYPIINRGQDVFERISFARHLAGFLSLEKDEPSIVVGIEGKWGEGKTSCINLVKEVLKEMRPNPIVVEYQPWLISTLDSVIEGFFLELASALGVQSKSQNALNAAEKVLRFGKMLAPIKLIPGAEPWGSLVENVLSTVGGATKAYAGLADLSLQTRKKDLENHLTKIKRPIVVIVDDVDRLPPDQVRIVFQLLKAVCDFKRVSYLIAYDPEPIKKALSYDKTYDGKRYLEKIVQVSYGLPRLSFTHMKDFLERQVQNIIDKYEIPLKDVEANLFSILLNRTDIVRMFETPRDIVRLCNRLRVSGPNTKNEVSFADLVAFEALELKCPDLTQIVRSEPDKFIGTIGVDQEFGSSNSISAFYLAAIEDEKKGNIPLDLLLKRSNYSDRINEFVRSLLLFLFPRLGGQNYHERDVPISVNRVRNRDSFLKLLHCGTASFTFSSEEARRFCKNPDERQKILAEYCETSDLYSWLGFLEDVADNSTIEEPMHFCEVLLAKMAGPETILISNFHAKRVGDFLYQIIKTQQDGDLRWKMLDSIVTNQTSLSVSEQTLLRFLNDYGIWHEGNYVDDPAEAEARFFGEMFDFRPFSYEQLYAAKNKWLDVVRMVADTKDIMKAQKGFVGILYRWGQLNGNDFSEPQSYVMTKSESDTWLSSYLKLFSLGTDGGDILPFIPEDAFDQFVKRVEWLGKRDEHASKVTEFLRRVQENMKEKPSAS